MFATLLLIRHVADGGREATTLEPGATLAAELMRLYPRGLGRPFEVYLREVRDENLIPAATHETHQVIEGERYILVLRLGAVAIPFLIKFAIALAVSVAVQVITKALTPKPQQASSNAQTEAMSPNNSLAGQTNTLRPGARVPDMLGRMRCWPDLIANAQETWNGRNQWLVEWFVLGMGKYDIENARLGETALAGLTGAQLVVYDPGVFVPPITCVKRSPLVDNLSLLTEQPTASGAQTTFSPPNTMSSTLFVPISLGAFGTPVRIGNTTYNNGLFDCTQIPQPTQTDPPFVYRLEQGTVRAEQAEDAIVRPCTEILFIGDAKLTWSAGDIVTQASQGWVPVAGQIVRLRFFNFISNNWTFVAQYLGTIISVIAEQGPGQLQYRFTFNNFAGSPITISTSGALLYLVVYEDTGDIYTGLAGELPQAGEIIPLERARQLLGRADQMYTVWTDWQTAPFANPKQLLIDIAFPQGLVWYNKGDRKPYTVQVQAEFKRLDAPAAQGTATWTFTNSTQGALRYTQRVDLQNFGAIVNTAGSGSPYIQTRLRRTTPWVPDNNENQYIADTRWQTYSATVQVPGRVYGDVTLLQLTLWNTRAAGSIGETSLNVIATRWLPWWGGSMWMPARASQSWADALVARMKATDGANKTDADIDLAGIYAIQRQLDAQDGGDQGRIAITLDQMQDIDAELQSIASIARCQLYRVGPRLYVERDQGGKSAIALFTGRSKHPDAETVSVTLTSDADPDAVIVPWWDRRDDAWKQREYQWPQNITPINPLRIAPAQATWAQAYRRARYEWNRLTMRRETLTLKATEEASLVHPGDVVNVTDDVGNLSQSAGEVFDARGLDLELDQEVDLSAGDYVILLRSLNGRTTDVIPVSQVSPTDVRLARPATFELKGRDDALGSMFALYRTERSTVIPWLVTAIEPEERYLTLSATNWTEAVFAADWPAALPGIPVIPYSSAAAELLEAAAQPLGGVVSDEDLRLLEVTP